MAVAAGNAAGGIALSVPFRRCFPHRGSQKDFSICVMEGDAVKRNAFALLVHERPEPCLTLKILLRRLGMDTFSVGSCGEAAHLLEQTHPHLVFTDKELPDGSWIDVVTLAQNAPTSICSILVGPPYCPDLRESALRYGAFDFLAPPFDAEAIGRLVSQAMIQVRALREGRSRAAVA